MKVPETRFQIDLKIARGLDYYTGTVYETVLNDYPEVGSVCSGGRYDNLASHYTNTPLPGVGISIGLSRLFYKLIEAKVITPTQQSPAQVVVMPIDEAQIEPSLAVAALLRDANIPTMLYSELSQVKRKMRYADRMGYKYVILIGAKEAEEGTTSVKNMETGESETIAVADLVQHLL
jgi:histidyl-tRNA synthetase